MGTKKRCLAFFHGDPTGSKHFDDGLVTFFRHRNQYNGLRQILAGQFHDFGNLFLIFGIHKQHGLRPRIRNLFL